ncbi:MAG TPA: hypothetical protein DCR27_04785, partial [Lachnospiraceae bacterium]|nr:hypothetical protein [Lachnospiraceae bacterium]
LYVSHNMATIRNLCTRCIVLDKGKIVFNGDVEKAVSIYMDQSSSELFAYYGKDFFLKKLYDTGMTAVEEMELLNKHTARYHTGETMHLRIRWRAMADIKDVRFGISIKYIDAGNIGFAESPHTCSCQANASYESTLAFEISNLAEGIYYMHLCIYTQNEMGELQSIYETDKMYFEVMELDKGKIIWHRQYWGSIRLNSIKLLQNVCLET